MTHRMTESQKQPRDQNTNPTCPLMKPGRSRAKKIFPLALVLVAVAFPLLYACSGEGTALTASRAWVLKPSAVGSSSGGLTLHNRTNEDRVLQHVVAADFRAAGLRAKTEPGTDSTLAPPFIVAAGQATRLPPAGTHFFLEGPRRLLDIGDETLLALHFDNGLAVFVNAEVRAFPLPNPVPEP